ncbi:MAG: hypothetical protein KGL36_07780 [Gammaproteobacteria bacterium]|nr:hypothetical protein [Gammaproteobacteria bacterium]
MSTPPEFGEISASKLAGLIFELASQLHVERAHRLTLQAALEARGLITPESIEATAGESTLRASSEAAADASIRALLRILSEASDERTPLRDEAPKS